MQEYEEISSVLLADSIGSSVSGDTDCEMILFDEVRSITQNEKVEAVDSTDIHSKSPLPSFKQVIFDNVVNHFLILFNADQSELSKASRGIINCTETSSSTQSDQASTLKAAQISAPGNKRKRGVESREDDQNEDESWKRRKGHDPNQALSKPAAGHVVRFSCPYKKRDPQIYTATKWKSCAASSYDSISRLKLVYSPFIRFDHAKFLRGHLYRRHRAPIQCRRCGDTFSTQNELDAHAKLLEACIILDPLPYVGFGIDIEKTLRQRSKWGQQTDVHQWNEIYRTLFPGEDIPSPCKYMKLRPRFLDDS